MSTMKRPGCRARPDPTPDAHKGGSMAILADDRAERITELWVHLFEGLEEYLVTFTGQQSARSDARPNELDAPQQCSWRWPTQHAEAANYLLQESEAERDAYFGVHLFRKSGTRKGKYAGEVQALWV